jgi:hypothetical protein
MPRGRTSTTRCGRYHGRRRRIERFEHWVTVFHFGLVFRAKVVSMGAGASHVFFSKIAIKEERGERGLLEMSKNRNGLVNVVLMSVARVCWLLCIHISLFSFLISLPFCDQSVICGRGSPRDLWLFTLTNLEVHIACNWSAPPPHNNQKNVVRTKNLLAARGCQTH